MKKCKYCQAEIPENSTFCPVCSKRQTDEDITAEPAPEETSVEQSVSAGEATPEEAATPVEEAATPAGETAPAEEASPAAEAASEENAAPAGAEPSAEIQEGIKATPGKIALAVAAVVVLLAVLVALIVSGVRSSKPEETEPAQTTAATGETAEAAAATVPADGNPDDETCKGTYTVTDEEVIAAGDTVVATSGDFRLTNAELQVYYWMEVRSFLSSYGSYASYIGLDYTQPLDTQVCSWMENGTWQQYFLARALDSWQTYQAMAAEAEAAGHTMSEEYQGYLDTLETDMEESAVANGFADARDLLAANVGAGADIADYVRFMEVYYRGMSYYSDAQEGFVPTEEELENYFAQHEAEYAENGLTMDDLYVDVRHILVFPEGADSETIYTETFSDEAWAAAETEAQAILNEWLAGEKTEESFADLANEKSADPGSNTNGGLYTDVTVGQMVAPFEEWCFDAIRQVGDYGIVKTDLGYHVMFFSGSRPMWKSQAESDLITEKANSLVDEAVANFPITVDYAAIKLGYVNLAG